MKKIVKKLLTLTLLLACLTFVTGKFANVFAAPVVPTDFTTISTNKTTDILSNMDNNFGVFRFSGNTGFVNITLKATKTNGEVTYPAGAIQVKDANYQLMKKLNVAEYDMNATNDNVNNLSVQLPKIAKYYVEINYNTANLTSLTLTVENAGSSDNTTDINMFDYNNPTTFTANLLQQGVAGDQVKRFVVKQPGRFEIKSTVTGTLSNDYVVVLFNSSRKVIYSYSARTNYAQTVDLDASTYYIGYFNLSNSATIRLDMTRKVTSPVTNMLMTDPRKGLTGSEITVNEKNSTAKSYNQSFITEGFTRLIFMEATAPSQSRLDYDWYSSNTKVATVSSYGTVLALPIAKASETVNIVAVYKKNPAITYVREFTILQDTSVTPIDIPVSMTVAAGKETLIDLNGVDVPINILSDYEWVSSKPADITVTGWGLMKVGESALGKNILILGNYKYNKRVRIVLSVFVTLALSGYEKEYNPSLWNGQTRPYNNCYAYALNNQVYPGTNWLWFQQPGEYAGNWAEDFTNEEEMRAAVLSDFVKYNEDFGTNLVFQPIGKYDACPAGTYKVALVANSSNEDYHWYRQDADGYWSHKPGGTAVTRYDYSGNLIIDPETADRRNGYFEYDLFLGFYAVSSWDNMYQATTSKTLSVAQLQQPIYGVNTVPTVSSSLMGQLSVGMTIDQVVDLLGTAGQSVGSGAIIHQYTTTTQENVQVRYALNENGQYVVTAIFNQ
ncbi:MAG: hypothetical protein NC182_06200 [Prevotella sp.]|nr:hypothetical protein [Staphylococcus sp.]MCM1350776.1 hypothetical protein [Prevotella sp.]